MVHFLDYISGQPATQCVLAVALWRGFVCPARLTLPCSSPAMTRSRTAAIARSITPSRRHSECEQALGSISLGPVALTRVTAGSGGFATVKQATSKDDGREVSPSPRPDLAPLGCCTSPYKDDKSAFAPDGAQRKPPELTSFPPSHAGCDQDYREGAHPRPRPAGLSAEHAHDAQAPAHHRAHRVVRVQVALLSRLRAGVGRRTVRPLDRVAQLPVSPG